MRRFIKTSSMLVAAILLVIPTLGGKSSPAVAAAPVSLHSGYTGGQPGAAAINQALAYWYSPAAFSDTANDGYTRWVGINNYNYGYLFQAGEWVQNGSGNVVTVHPFWEIYTYPGGQPCQTIHIYDGLGDPDYEIYLDDYMYAQVSILDNTHYDVIITNLTENWKIHIGSQYCAYAYHMFGGSVEFADERFYSTSCYTVTSHNSNAFLGPRGHLVGEGGNVYHYLAYFNYASDFAYDDEYDGPGGTNLVMYPGGLGTNSNFTEYSVWPGDRDPC